MTASTLPLTKLPVGGVSPAVLVCGDPARASRLAELLDNAALLSEWREYRAYHGAHQGIPVTICSHGIGAPGAAIAFEELIAAGGRCLIRVGTCGGLQPDIGDGDVVIATAAVQCNGYAREAFPAGYPAVADLDVSLALRTAAQTSQQPARMGLVVSRDVFYAGITTPHTPNYQDLAQANVLAVEMECAALFLVGSLRRVQTGAILAVDGNVLGGGGETMDSYQPHRTIVGQAIAAASRIALAAIYHLYAPVHHP